MRRQITRNQIRGIKKAVGYCQLDNAMKFYTSIGYGAGVYGWNYDAYEIGNTAILTGYRPEGRKTDYEAVKRIDDYALKQIKSGALDDDGKAYNVRAIITAMIEAL